MTKHAITCTIVSAGDIRDPDELFALFSRYYTDITYCSFMDDLREKDEVLLFRAENRLIAFTTVLCREMPHLGRGLFVFSGDTVVHEDYWGMRHLQSGFSGYIFRKKLRHPHLPLYWMLISKGYKTYMLMRRNCPRSFPSFEAATPPELKRVMDGFYTEKFGAAYSASTSLIEWDTSHGAVKGNLAEPSEADLTHPDIRFFVERNPRYAEGVELACIAEIRFRDYIGMLPKYFLRFRRGRST